MLYILAYAFGTFLMYDFQLDLDKEIHQWEVECNGEIHVIEHWQQPDPEIECKVIKMVLEAGNDLAPILDDKKKYKP